MALVTALKHQTLQSHSPHTEVECTFDVITGEGSQKYLQLDTYGSKGRKMPGKKSQSLRLAPPAIAQLKKLIQEYAL